MTGIPSNNALTHHSNHINKLLNLNKSSDSSLDDNNSNFSANFQNLEPNPDSKDQPSAKPIEDAGDNYLQQIRKANERLELAKGMKEGLKTTLKFEDLNTI